MTHHWLRPLVADMAGWDPRDGQPCRGCGDPDTDGGVCEVCDVCGPPDRRRSEEEQRADAALHRPPRAVLVRR